MREVDRESASCTSNLYAETIDKSYPPETQWTAYKEEEGEHCPPTKWENHFELYKSEKV